MRNDRSGATDVLSSLPIIACCIFAVMVLLVAMGQAAGRDGRNGGEELGESCEALLEEALRNMTVRSVDGRRYLDNDWFERAATVVPAHSQEDPLSSSIEVRLLGETPREISLSGNISGCREAFSASSPVILVAGNTCIPGEIVARVGR